MTSLSLHEESYETDEQNFKKLNKWTDIPCSELGRCNTVKISGLPNLIYRFNEVSIKIPAHYFGNTDKLITKFTWKENDPD